MDNKLILATRFTKYNQRKGARVGDYLRLWAGPGPCPAHRNEFTRFTHDWGDSLQTGGHSGSSYYLGDGYLSYSGSLDSGISRASLIQTNYTKMGDVWFFDEDWAGAGRGVNFEIPHRVFTIKPGANTNGIEFESEYYWLQVLTEEYHQRTCNYWYTITARGCMAHTAFTTERELLAWMDKKGLVLAQPLTPPGTASSQRLLWKVVTP